MPIKVLQPKAASTPLPSKRLATNSITLNSLAKRH